MQKKYSVNSGIWLKLYIELMIYVQNLTFLTIDLQIYFASLIFGTSERDSNIFFTYSWSKFWLHLIIELIFRFKEISNEFFIWILIFLSSINKLSFSIFFLKSWGSIFLIFSINLFISFSSFNSLKSIIYWIKYFSKFAISTLKFSLFASVSNIILLWLNFIKILLFPSIIGILPLNSLFLFKPNNSHNSLEIK